MSQILMGLMPILQITLQINISDMAAVLCFHCHWYLTQKGHPKHSAVCLICTLKGHFTMMISITVPCLQRKVGEQSY